LPPLAIATIAIFSPLAEAAAITLKECHSAIVFASADYDFRFSYNDFFFINAFSVTLFVAAG
jgi:hypothetical protein